MTKQDFFEGNEETRVKQYMHALESLRSVPLRNSVILLETCSWALLHLNRFQIQITSKLPSSKKTKSNADRDEMALPYLLTNRLPTEMDSIALCKFISKFTQDTVLQLAIAGCIEYKLQHPEKALYFFKAAAEHQPDFGEVHWYLSAVLNELHMKDQADLQQQMAEKLSISPFIDN